MSSSRHLVALACLLLMACHEGSGSDIGPELLKRHREIIVLHLPRQALSDRHLEAAWRTNIPLVASDKKWLEEWEPLDMVPMSVRE